MEFLVEERSMIANHQLKRDQSFRDRKLMLPVVEMRLAVPVFGVHWWLLCSQRIPIVYEKTYFLLFVAAQTKGSIAAFGIDQSYSP